MRAKEKAPEGALKHHKDTGSSRVTKEIRRLFLTGRRFSAMELNELAFTGDSRKVISVLRSRGWDIRDRWVDGTRKEYWLHLVDKRQLSLFDEEGGNE